MDESWLGDQEDQDSWADMTGAFLDQSSQEPLEDAKDPPVQLVNRGLLEDTHVTLGEGDHPEKSPDISEPGTNNLDDTLDEMLAEDGELNGWVATAISIVTSKGGSRGVVEDSHVTLEMGDQHLWSPDTRGSGLYDNIEDMLGDDEELSSWVATAIATTTGTGGSKEDDICTEKEDDLGMSMKEDDLKKGQTPSLGGLTPTPPYPNTEGSLEKQKNLNRVKESPRRVPDVTIASPVEGYGGVNTLGGSTAHSDVTPQFYTVGEDDLFGGGDARVLTLLEGYKIPETVNDDILCMKEQTDRDILGSMGKQNDTPPAPPVNNLSRQDTGKLSHYDLTKPACLVSGVREGVKIGYEDPPPKLISTLVHWNRTASQGYRVRTIFTPPLCSVPRG